MEKREKTIVVMPAYNAAQTLDSVLADIPSEGVDEILLVDDCSQDDTVAKARSLGLFVVEHERNQGYGAGLRTAFDYTLKHDDGQRPGEGPRDRDRENAQHQPQGEHPGLACHPRLSGRLAERLERGSRSDPAASR